MHLTLSPPVPNNSCSRGSGGCQKRQGEQISQRYEGGQALDKGIRRGLGRRLDDEDGSVVGDMTSIRPMVTLSTVTSMTSIPGAMSLCVVFSASVVIPGVIIVVICLIVIGVGEESLLHLAHC